jgi:uncharacterized membrane protein
VDAGTREILDLVFRWIHVVAGIMWIGNSLLFNWLDRNLLSPAADKEGIQGDIWLLHSGAFYYVEKDLKGWDRSRPLHWFKWQAYTTWLTGAVLLGVVYYASGGALLIDPAVANLSLTSAVALSVGVLAGGWLLYDLVISRLLAQMGGAGAAMGLLLVIGIAFGLSHVFSGRAAFLHVGALLGTLMAGNVFRVIMPSQRQLVAGVERGARPDPVLAARAKERSIHNNYLTFPVVVLMLSSHFAGLYGHQLSWLLLGILVFSGAAVRHLLNIRFTYPQWRPALAAVAVATLAGLYLVAARPAASTAPMAHGLEPQRASFAQVQGVIDKRCTVCHSASPADRTFGIAPAGVAFDTPEQIRARADRILARAVETQTMPPGNKTWITPEEREILRRWIVQGAKAE